MATFFTHTTDSIGDNLWSLQYLRKQAVLYPEHRFLHSVPRSLLAPLISFVADLHNLSIIDSECRPHFSKNTWVNTENFIEHHPDRWNISAVLIDFFAGFSKKNGMESGLRSNSDLQFEIPEMIKTQFIQNFDFLIINSRPVSGQFPDYDSIDDLIGELHQKGHSIITTAPSRHPVICTENHRLSLSAIGCLSRNCKNILGVATGPIWPTFNVWNADSVQLRLLLVTPWRVWISPNTEHADTVDAARTILKHRDLL